MSNPMLQLIVLAAIAVFLILRLRGVLGSRDGFEPPAVPEAPPARRMPADTDIATQDEDDVSDHVEPASPAARALEAMKRADPSFTVGPFLLGARQAYEMILTAFERGDLTDVRAFLSPAVAEAFDGAIESRRAARPLPRCRCRWISAWATARPDAARRRCRFPIRRRTGWTRSRCGWTTRPIARCRAARSPPRRGSTCTA